MSGVQASPKLYRVSALASGFVRLWRGWQVIVPVLVVNALVQALLILPITSVNDVAVNTLLAVLSAIVALKSFVIISLVAVRVADGRVTWSAVWPALRRSTWVGMLWGALLLLAVVIGFSVYTVPGVVLAAVTPFVVLAAVGGARNPISANFRTIGRRFWRWLVTAILTGLALTAGYLGSGFVMFFLRGMLGASLIWLAAGFVSAWFVTAWALIYRSAQDS